MILEARSAGDAVRACSVDEERMRGDGKGGTSVALISVTCFTMVEYILLKSVTCK